MTNCLKKQNYHLQRLTDIAVQDFDIFHQNNSPMAPDQEIKKKKLCIFSCYSIFTTNSLTPHYLPPPPLPQSSLPSLPSFTPISPTHLSSSPTHHPHPPFNLTHPSTSPTLHPHPPFILTHPSSSPTLHPHPPFILIHPSSSPTLQPHSPFILTHPSPPTLHPLNSNSLYC